VGIDMLINSADDNKLWNGQGLSATTLFNSEGQVILDFSKKEYVDSYNTWDTSEELAEAIRTPPNRQKVGRHDMVIIGYCDSPDRNIYEKGLFILRNSWGKDNAIDGNNFVTYEYAYVFSDEIISVGTK
jgi:C1A family cysteine protease